ncbi:MAG TPA: ABC transporter permease [Chloroflexota bacterium]|nr:ABC transporter permease [Chloroflexota bacterium]
MLNLLNFTVKRFLAMILVVWVITTVVFFLAHLSPSDPIRLLLGQTFQQNREEYYRLRHLFGLDQPLWHQYLTYMVGLAHGQLGYSEEPSTLGRPVWTLLRYGIPVSLKLGGVALALALLVGLPVGLVSALYQNSIVDHGSQTVMMIGYAIPTFVLAPIAQLIIGVDLKWLPVSGWGDPGLLGIKEMIMPVGLFALGLAGFFAKSFRSFLLEVLQQDYIRTARAKGLRQRTIIYVHAMKNTLVSLATIVGPTIAYLIVGAFIIENFFNIPGIGNITVTAVTQSDHPVIEATTILLAISVVVINFLTDIFYALIDPRVSIS